MFVQLLYRYSHSRVKHLARKREGMDKPLTAGADGSRLRQWLVRLDDLRVETLEDDGRFPPERSEIAATVQAAGNQPAHQLHRRLVVLVHEPVSRLIELVELLGDDCVYHLEIDPEVLVRNQVVKDRRP